MRVYARVCVCGGVVGSVKCQVCKIGFLLPFLGDLRHFWVKVDKLYHFGKKIEIKAL